MLHPSGSASTLIPTVPRGLYIGSDTFDGRTSAQVAIDCVWPPIQAACASARAFYHGSFALAEPHLLYFYELKEGMDEFLGLLAFAFMVDPCGTLVWCRDNVVSRKRVPQILARTGREVALDAAYRARIAHKLVFLLWCGSEDRAKHASGKQRELPHPGPTPEGCVRVKRYSGPDSAWLKWPAGLGDCWVDLPIEPDGSLDLRPLKRIWNMENCYVMLASPSNQIRLGRQPDEKLSALAWRVSLGPDLTLSVIERPTPETIAARRCLALLKNGLDISDMVYALTWLSSLLLWVPITFVALVAFAFRQALRFYVILALNIILHTLGQLLVMICVIGPCARRGYDNLRFTLWMARRNGVPFPGLVWEAVRELLLGLCGVAHLAWTVILFEVGLLGDEQVARLGRDRELDREMDVSSDSESIVEVEGML